MNIVLVICIVLLVLVFLLFANWAWHEICVKLGFYDASILDAPEKLDTAELTSRVFEDTYNAAIASGETPRVATKEFDEAINAAREVNR